VLVFFEKKPDGSAPKLFIIEVGRDKTAPGGVFRVAPQNMLFTPDAVNDFAVTMNVVKQQGLVYLVTKMGYLFLLDIFSGKTVYRARITQDSVFAAVEHTVSSTLPLPTGIICVTRKGQVLSISLNEAALVPYIVSQLRDAPLAIDLAARLNLSGADELYQGQFQQLLAAGDIAGAARVAAESPRQFLRTAQTIAAFQSVASPAGGGPQPVFQYFSVLLEKGKLNKLETIELAKPVIQQGRAALLEKWIAEDKLELCEELGDMLAIADPGMAFKVYQGAPLGAVSPDKLINSFLQRGDYDAIISYAASVHYDVNYGYILQQLVRSNPSAAVDFAKKLACRENAPPLMDANTVLEIFMSVSLVREATAFLLEALKNNRKEEGYLQTKLLEINFLSGSPQVADAIIGNGLFSHYDRVRVGALCEQYGLAQRALEHYSDVNDIKRVLQNNAAALSAANPEFLLSFFGSISKESSLEILKDLLSRNIRNNLNLVVQVATKYNEALGSESLIKLFEDFKSYEGLFYYLGAIVNFSQSSLVHFKYIESASRMQQFKEVERVCRDSTVYDPEEVKKFLMEAKLPDPR
jgi:clathrin heavy chain